jgi:hypothetical protein
MKVRKWAFCLGVTALCAGLYTYPARADFYCESESVSTNLSHRRSGPSIQKYYFTPDALRVELGNNKVFIVDCNTMEFYSLNTKAKTGIELNLGELPAVHDTSADDRKKLGEMMAALLASQVTPTNESKTIAGYKCRKYNVHFAVVNGEYWISEDVRGYQELKKLGARVGAIAERHPVLRQIDVAGMVEKLGGFPVYTVNHVMGGTVESTLKRIEQKPLDPALFVVPKGYAIKKSNWARRSKTGELETSELNASPTEF